MTACTANAPQHGCHDDTSEEGAVQVAHDFLEDKRNGGERGVESSR